MRKEFISNTDKNIENMLKVLLFLPFWYSTIYHHINELIYSR